MKALIIPLALIATPLFAEIRLTGVSVVDEKGPRFVLEDTITKAKGVWIPLGSTFGKYLLAEYDQSDRVLLLKSPDDILRVKLIEATIKNEESKEPVKTGAPKETQEELASLSDEELLARGYIRLKRGTTYRDIALSAGLSVEELIAMNPDVDYRRLRVGQVVRVASVEMSPTSGQSQRP